MVKTLYSADNLPIHTVSGKSSSLHTAANLQQPTLLSLEYLQNTHKHQNMPVKNQDQF